MSTTDLGDDVQEARSPAGVLRNSALIFMLVVLLPLGLLHYWKSRQEEHPVRLLLTKEGCAAMRLSDFPEVSPRTDGGCEVRVILLPSPMFNTLQTPSNQMYRLRPIPNTKVEEIWLKKNLVGAIIYEQY